MLTAIAIDDESKALEILRIHAGKTPFLDLKETFRDPLNAIEWLQNNPVDLLFLDINMPKLSGLQFRSLIGESTLIIFTTAYAEYALESYELDAVDYLLKPIRFERFLKAVLKARARLEPKVATAQDETGERRESSLEDPAIYVKSGAKLYKLNSSEILYLHKEGNYITFHAANRKVLARLTMEQALALLPETEFLQVHKSYIISLRHLDVIELHQATVGGQIIPVAKAYRAVLRERIE
jgi:DNA-binding LytR/AlgR family response regulator